MNKAFCTGIRERTISILSGIKAGTFERDEAIALSLLSAMAGESIFLLGLPGVGKSMIARRLKLAFKDASVFEYLMSRFSTPDEIFGPILRGRDIKRYSYDWAGLYLIYIPWHFPYQFDDSITGASQKSEEAFKTQYPAVYEHLLGFKDVLSKRNQAETGIRYEWYALQRWGAKYWEDFSKPKIIYMEIQTDNPEDGYPFPCFSFDDNNAVVLNTAYIMCGEKDEITYILGVLNSSVGRYIAKYYVTQLQQRQFRMLAQYVGNFPIPKVDADEMRTVSKLVCNHFENQSSNDSCINEAIYHLYGLNQSEIEYVKQH